MDPLLLPTPEAENWIERFAASIHAECRRAREFLAENRPRLERAEEALQRCVRPAEDGAAPATDACDDYRRRYEMALDDLQELKTKHAELQRQLDQARANPAARGGGPVIDWEAEKRRILEALESDGDEGDAVKKAERQKIEDVIHATDRALAAKDRELEELRRKLPHHGGGAPSEAEQAAAVERAIDADAEIKRERERLEQLQVQWREKLRQAEVELSVERAEIARQRAELEKRKNSESGNASKNMVQGEKPEQPANGRWLARLGLTEADREQRRRR
ncbi:MAG: hypothetical protein JW959_13690 [Pirellulales bacterium]|nr:hypothetical protein [Pirellulales bacterium]